MVDFLGAFTECWWPGLACRPRWEAWAAVGAWAAAVATFLAVLLPFRRQRAADTLRAEMAVAEFMPDLWKLAVRIREIRGFTEIPTRARGSQLAEIFVLRVSVPLFEPVPQLRSVIIACRRLKASISQWDLYASVLIDPHKSDEEPFGKLDDEVAESLLADLEVCVARVAREIHTALPELAADSRLLVRFLRKP